MADTGVARQFPQGERVDPALMQHNLRLIEKGRAEIAVMKRPSVRHAT
jgi:hypothetical protein